MPPATLPVALSIAGSDNSAGAGAQADLKTMSALGVYGVTAITCVVAEVPGKVSLIQPIRTEVVAEQIRLLFQAFPIAAVKTGMLHSAEIIRAVCESLIKACRDHPKSPPIIVDPVMVATSGHALLEPDGVRLYREQLFPMATLITPNLDEAGTLLGRSITTLDDLEAAGRELVAEYGCAFLMKGGHLRADPAVDLLCLPGGKVERFSAPLIRGVATHGT